MEFQGILKEKVGQREGDGQNGHWVKAQFLLEQEGAWPKRMVCDVMNMDFMDLVGKFESLIGKKVVVRFEINAREWNGKWYNDVRAHGIKEDISEEERQQRKAARRQRSELGTIEGPEGKTTVDAEGTVEENWEVDWNGMEKPLAPEKVDKVEASEGERERG